jgi:hypothetical protein
MYLDDDFGHFGMTRRLPLRVLSFPGVSICVA